MQFKGNSKDYEENPCFDLPYDAVFEEGERILVELTSKLFANRKTAGDVNLERGNEPFVRYRDPPPPPLLGLGFAAEHVKVRPLLLTPPPSHPHTRSSTLTYPCRSCTLVARWCKSNSRRSCACTAAPCPLPPRVWLR